MPAKHLIREDEEGVYSHIYNKGVEKRIIFNDEEDYQVFLDYLSDYLSPLKDPSSIKQDFTVHGQVFRGTPHQPKNYFNKVELVAYSLMPDHYHLVLRHIVKGSLENFIRSLCTRYSIYFNKKYHRTGSLFAGPYKSVQVRDEPGLLYLTRYLHLAGTHTSYAEYLGKKDTQWIKSDLVLSSFGKEPTAYQDFVEKSQPDQKEMEALREITFEAGTKHPDLTSIEKDYPTQAPIKPEKISSGSINPNLKPHQRIPEFLATFVIFSLLLAIGITNIMISQNDQTKSFTLGIATYLPPPTNSPTPSLTPIIPKTEETPPAPVPADAVSTAPDNTVSTAPADAVKTEMLTVKIIDGAQSVNIRQKPTSNSPKVGKANGGDTFELVSVSSGWYEIKLADGSTGFITSKYIKTEGENN